MATESQIRANRRNAQRSTGPRTPEGRKKSSVNAFRHGGYANTTVAIPRGHFQENPEEVEAFIDEIVRALDPRDQLEMEEARNIATAYLRLRRVAALEAESIAGGGADRQSVDTVPDDPLLEDPLTAHREASALRVLDSILDISSKIEGRSSTAVDRAHDRYRMLRSRNLDS